MMSGPGRALAWLIASRRESRPSLATTSANVFTVNVAGTARSSRDSSRRTLFNCGLRRLVPALWPKIRDSKRDIGKPFLSVGKAVVAGSCSFPGDNAAAFHDLAFFLDGAEK